MSHHPIGELALLSDCHSAALVDRTGSIDWWCLPNFASPSVFARLLDERAGHFRIGVSGQSGTERRYLDETLVLRTTLRTAEGTLELHDALAMAPGVREHALGLGLTHVILRLARCTRGRVDLEVEFTPRYQVRVDNAADGDRGPGRGCHGGSPRPSAFRLPSTSRYVSRAQRHAPR